MNDLELVWLALNSLRHRKLRSWLAVLGIVIGVAAVVSLISISTGLNENIEKNLGGLGANTITISSGSQRAERSFMSSGFQGAPPGGAPPGDFGGQQGSSTSSSSGITFQEADYLKSSVGGIEQFDVRLQKSAQVSYGIRNSSLTVIGTTPSAFPESTSTAIVKGRGLSDSDTYSVVIGASVEEMFNQSMLTRQIRINGIPFRVVGVLNASGATFQNLDRGMFIPLKAAKTLFNETETVSSIVVITEDGRTDEVMGKLTALLQSLHGVTNETQDFTVSSASSMQSTITSVSNTLALFLGAIAGISLIVGGIGAANAMFTSVLEQTRYIGLLKALGARNRMVMKLFIYESGMMGLAGGILGVTFSFAGSALIETFGLPSKLTPELMVMGLGFSVIVGVVSGAIPARNAASVEPIEALKYE